jgi:pimeloyl-ACP methyl ester carboxylesterase
LKYIFCGDGEKALVFLHGALVEPDMWFYPILELEKRFRIIAPFFPHQMMGAQDASDFIHAILKQENIYRAVFIGMSYGGGVVQYLAEKQPDLIDKLILTHTGIAGRKESIEQIEKTRKIVRLLPFFLMKKKLKNRIEYVPASEWNEFHEAYFLETISRLTKPLFLDYLETMIRFDRETRDFSADTRKWEGETVLLGTRNDKDAFKYFDRLLKLYPNSSSYIFEEEGGHHTSFLFPEKYTRVLSRYLV